MKVLVISPQPFFSPRGTPLSVYYRALAFARMGVKLDILTYGEGRDIFIPGAKIIRIPHFKLLGKIKTGPSILKLFLDVLLALKTISLLIKNNYHFVHAHEEAVFFCRFLKPIFRFKLLYDMHSSLPQQLVNFDYTRSVILIRLFQMLEKTCLMNADAVITVCPELSKHALAKMPDRNRHVLIENSIVDDVPGEQSLEKQDEFYGIAKDCGLILDSLPKVPLVFYTGSLEHYQGIELLMQSFRQVLHAKPDTALIIVGGDEKRIFQLKELAEDQGLDNACVFLGQASQAKVASLMQLASILVSPRISGNNTPLKIYQYISSGIPLVATRISSHTQILSDTECWLVDPTPDAMAQGILNALSDHRKSAEKAEAALALYRREYSDEIYNQRMRQVLAILNYKYS